MLYCLWCTTYVHVGLSLSVYHLIPISPHSVSDLYKILCMCTSKKILWSVGKITLEVPPRLLRTVLDQAASQTRILQHLSSRPGAPKPSDG